MTEKGARAIRIRVYWRADLGVATAQRRGPPITGPVLHSFPDDDMTLDTADDEPEARPSVPAQMTAPATEMATGGSSSVWRADTPGGSDIAGESGVAGGSELAV